MPKGFTLVEMLLVFFIISLLTSISLFSSKNAEGEFSLLRSASKLAQDIRRAQEMAMASKKCCGGKIPAGYGIHLKQGDNFYLLYADTNPTSGNEKYDGGDDVIEKVYFEKTVYIKDVSISSLSINFSPPDPKVRIGSDNAFDEIFITLSLTGDQTKEKKVRVNKVGLISIE